MSADWIDAVAQLRDDGSPGVLVTVVRVRGHAPRNAGAKMVVAADHTWGSVGGGDLEHTAVTTARHLLRTGTGEPEHLTSRLTDRARHDHGRQCCGGEVDLLLEPLPVRPAVCVFGAGHVGHELARILSRQEGWSLHLVDSRTEMLDPLRLADVTGGPARVTVHHQLLPEAVLARLPRRAHLLVMTHDHAEDFAICDAALRDGRAASLGLIGSSVKWTRFRHLLAEAGHPQETIARIDCPIGVDCVRGKEPASIAVGVAAALLARIESSPSEGSRTEGSRTERPQSSPACTRRQAGPTT